jgi:hypothetical protein
MKEWLSIVVINWLTRRAAAESSNYGDSASNKPRLHRMVRA